MRALASELNQARSTGWLMSALHLARINVPTRLGHPDAWGVRASEMLHLL